MPSFEVDCVLSVDGDKQRTNCWVKRNIVRATIYDDIPKGSQIRLDLLSMSNAVDLATCYNVSVMNSTYTAGFYGKACADTDTLVETVSNFIDIYDVEASSTLRKDSGETQINFALYGDSSFTLMKDSVFSVEYPPQFNLAPFHSLDARDSSTSVTCALKSGVWGSDTFDDVVFEGCGTNSLLNPLGNDVEYVHEDNAALELAVEASTGIASEFQFTALTKGANIAFMVEEESDLQKAWEDYTEWSYKFAIKLDGKTDGATKARSYGVLNAAYLGYSGVLQHFYVVEFWKEKWYLNDDATPLEVGAGLSSYEYYLLTSTDPYYASQAVI